MARKDWNDPGPSPRGRLEARAAQIRASGRVERVDCDHFRVPSQSRGGKWHDVAFSGGRGRCSCEYYAKWGGECKHVIAAGGERGGGAAGAAADGDGGGGRSGKGAAGRCRPNCKCGGTACAGIPDGAEGCACACMCRIDPRAYDFVTTGGKIRLLRLILETMDMVDDVPYVLGVGFGGRRGYPPRTMAAVALMRTFLRNGSRDMVGELNDSSELRGLLNLERGGIPGKSTICDTYHRMSQGYLRKVNLMIVSEIERGGLAVDSTGKSTNMFEPWSTIRKEDGLQKGYLKLHAVADIDTRAIIDFEITDANVSDIRVFREFLDRLPGSRGGDGGRSSVCADAAYLARDVCTAIEDLGYVPLIMPKSNTSKRAAGHPAWRRMVTFALEQYEEFKELYGRRSVIESIFGALKRVYGNGLSMRRPDSQRTEMILQILCHNSARICRNRFSRDGGVYPEQADAPGRQEPPLFYPPGSGQRRAALGAAALFDRMNAAA